MSKSTQERPRVVHVHDNHPAVRAVKTIRDAFGDEVDLPVEALFEALDDAERKRVEELCSKLRQSPVLNPDPEAMQYGLGAGPAAAFRPGPDERALAKTWADLYERRPAKSSRVQHRQTLMAAFARERERRPAAAEAAVFRGVTEDQTLDDLRGELDGAGGTPRSAGIWWGSLDQEEEDELEALVEKAAGDRGLFKRRRREKVEALEFELELRWGDEPSTLRQLAPEGAVVLPAALLGDLHAGKLRGIDVAFLGVVLLTFASGELHPLRARDLALEDDGETLVIGGGIDRLLTEWSKLSQYGSDAVASERKEIAERLVAAGWLELEGGWQAGRTSTARVRLGERMLAEGGVR